MKYSNKGIICVQNNKNIITVNFALAQTVYDLLFNLRTTLESSTLSNPKLPEITNHLIAVKRLEVFFSKAFWKGSHDVVKFKLEQNDISGNLLKILQGLLDNRKQRVLLNGQVSS